MSKKINLDSERYMWTTEANDYALIKTSIREIIRYAIYHIPTQCVVIIEEDEIYLAVIQAMLEANIQILDVKSLP